MTSIAPPHQSSDGKSLLGAIAAVAAVYVYFLLFAQFGFLKAVLGVLGEGAGVIRPVMAVMGLAGVAGSGAAAWRLDGRSGRRRLAAGLAVCAGAAVSAIFARGLVDFYFTAVLTGLGTGFTTVTLASLLRRAIGDRRLGLAIGLGTGLAYAFCNLPAVFAAAAATQAQISLLALAMGLLGGAALGPRFPAEAQTTGDHARAGSAAWILIFLVLVGLDSAAFYIIQHAAELKAATWTGTGRLVLNAGVHLGAAVLAGWAFDRGWLGRAVAFGAGALVLACGLINASFAGAAVPLYITGVSVYSAALVYYPARSGRPGLAALVYAVAGWGGSGLGIALAEGRDRLPPALILGAAGLLAAGLLARRLASHPGPRMNENGAA